MSYIKTPKNAKKYTCEKCDFNCSKQSDYNRHLLTAKHKMITNDVKNNYKNATPYTCECGKEYTYRQGLYAHKKRCEQKTPNPAKSNDCSSTPENRIVHEPISESMVIKCFQTMMETQAQAAQVAQVAQAAQADAHAAAAAEQTRLLIEAISLKGPQCLNV